MQWMQPLVNQDHFRPSVILHDTPAANRGVETLFYFLGCNSYTYPPYLNGLTVEINSHLNHVHSASLVDNKPLYKLSQRPFDLTQPEPISTPSPEMRRYYKGTDQV